MMKIALTVLLLLTNIYAENEMKPKINFYKNGKLMWLIDMTELNHKYSAKLIQEYYKDGYDGDDSYENYLNYVNTHKEYKYNDWRLPTKEEVLTLQLRNNFFLKLFASRERQLHEKAYDEEVFYDMKLGDYWTSTPCKDNPDEFVVVDFDTLRFG